MSLLEVQKAERRQRILHEAQALMVERGWSGVTMRDLAKRSRVSVPTVYNLIGGKDALLSALMESLFDQVSASLDVVSSSTVMRLRTLWRAGLRPFAEAPNYTRELMGLFLSGAGSNELRRAQDQRYSELGSAFLAEGQRRGEIATFVPAADLGWTMYTLWVSQLIRWARHDITTEEMQREVDRGLSLVLLGVALGPAREEVMALLQGAVAGTVGESMTRGADGEQEARSERAASEGER